MRDEAWYERVQFDLSCLADPGTPIDCDGDDRQLIVQWRMRGKTRTADFIHSLVHGLRVDDGSGATRPYPDFLSELADLRGVAQMISQSLASDLYVDVSASMEEGQKQSALALLGKLVSTREDERTKIIMLKGDPGAGKTQILRELACRQANAFLRGQATKLLLYVNAQGRALARLDEALAVALQDLRAGLTYHAVPSLARWDLLVPIIDGFDELLGTAGYEDAFSSLGEFLERLRGQGQILASARSVYYEEEFLSRADQMARSGDQAWTHESVSVEPWDVDNCEQYLELRVTKDMSEVERARVSEKVDELLVSNEQFAHKPLFFAKTVELVLDDPQVRAQDDLLTTLIDGFLSRELNEKLLDRQSRPLLSQRQIVRLLSEIAQEMWVVQTRELDPEAIRLIAEYVTEDAGVPAEDRQVVIERAPGLAFLSRAESQEGVAFEHESFFFDFLAQSLVSDYLGDQSANLRVVLGASALPDDVAERAGFYLKRKGDLNDNRLRALLSRLGHAGSARSLRTEQIRENAGRLAIEMIKGLGTDVVDQEITHVTFPGGNLVGVVFRRCKFQNVVARRTDLRGTQFLECEADDLHLIEPLLTPGKSVLALAGLDAERDVVGVRSSEGGSIVYAPEAVARILRECGAPVRDVEVEHPAPAFSELVERLMRAYRRANPICMEDPHLKALFGDVLWPDLQAALVSNGIVTVQTRGTGGPKKTFLRRQFLPEQIMAGVGGRQDIDARIAGFWRDLGTAQ